MFIYISSAILWTVMVEFIVRFKGEEFTWQDRVIHFIIAPLGFLYFIHNLINEYLNK